jgi:hypothetical protein
MKRHLFVTFGASALCMLAALGCAGNNHYVLQPPPPPAYGEAPPLVQVADRNGFRTGESDGARDVESGSRYRPRATRAYHDTPGYEGNLGPFGAYRDAFRNAYLRGYDKGFHRG